MSKMPIKMSLQAIDYSLAQIEELAKNPGVSDSILFFLDRMEDLFPGLTIAKKRTYVNIYLPIPNRLLNKDNVSPIKSSDASFVQPRQEILPPLELMAGSILRGETTNTVNLGEQASLTQVGSVFSIAPDVIVTAILDRDQPVPLVYLNIDTFPAFNDGFQSDFLDYPFFGDQFIVVNGETRDFMSRLALKLATKEQKKVVS